MNDSRASDSDSDSDDDDRRPVPCIWCRALFVPRQALGRWQCRFHPAGGGGGACCGYDARVVRTAVAHGDGALVDANDALGCLRADHMVRQPADAAPVVVRPAREVEATAAGAVVATLRAVTLAQVLAMDAWPVRVAVPIPLDSAPVTRNLRDAAARALRRAYRRVAVQEWWAAEVLREPLALVYERLRTAARLARRGDDDDDDDDSPGGDAARLAAYWESDVGRVRQPALTLVAVRRTAPAPDAATLYRVSQLALRHGGGRFPGQ